MAYILINPFMEQNTFTSNDSDLLTAATEIWDKLANNTKKCVEKSYFSLKDKDNELFHFSVNEKMTGGTITYNIQEYDNHDNDIIFLKTIGPLKLNKSGGNDVNKKNKKKSSSDSSSSSSSSSSSDDDLNIFKFKPKSNIQYSSSLVKPITSYYLEYYNIYNTRLIIPYFFSKYVVTLNPILIIN
jgi:hypothetical protein